MVTLSKANERDVASLQDLGIPPEWAILMTKACRHPRPRRWSVHAWLVSSFTWANTDEGHDFWHGVYVALAVELGVEKAAADAGRFSIPMEIK